MVPLRILLAHAAAVAVNGLTSQSTLRLAPLNSHDLLWQGLDVQSAGLAATQLSSGPKRGVDEAAITPSEHILVVGAFDSGTNLMEELLRRNLPAAVLGKEPGCPHRFWKHSNSGDLAFLEAVERLGRLSDGLGPKDTKVIVVLRSPISQVSSWHKAPYELSDCIQRPRSLWNSRCSARIAASLDLCESGTPGAQHQPDMSGYRDNATRIDFDSTMEVYNAYLRQYRSLASSGRLRGLKIVTYEEMLYDPRRVVEEVAAFLGAQAPRDIDVIEESAKSHGSSHGRDLALRIYGERRWLREIGEETVRSLCRALDMGLIGNLTEGKSFTNEPSRKPLPYSQDCLGSAMDEPHAGHSTIILTADGSVEAQLDTKDEPN